MRSYTYSYDHQKNIEDAKKEFFSAAELIPAYTELMKFIDNVSSGNTAEIKEKNIDDAFDCMIKRDKAIILLSGFTQEDKKKGKNYIETKYHIFKEVFKNSLKIKD